MGKGFWSGFHQSGLDQAQTLKALCCHRGCGCACLCCRTRAQRLDGTLHVYSFGLLEPWTLGPRLWWHGGTIGLVRRRLFVYPLLCAQPPAYARTTSAGIMLWYWPGGTVLARLCLSIHCCVHSPLLVPEALHSFLAGHRCQVLERNVQRGM